MQLHSADAVGCGSFGALTEAVERVFSGGKDSIGPAEYDALEAAISDASDRAGRLTDLLGAIAQAIREDRLARGNSHQHAHGFTKLGLYRSSKSGFSIRLHIWWSGIRAYDDSPHDHRWSFYSRLLSGSLRIRNFAEHRSTTNPEPEQWCKYRYHDASADGVKLVEPAGPAMLGLASECILQAGCSHTLAPTQPHQVFGRDGAIAGTLVVTAPPTRSYSNVYHKAPRSENRYSFAGQRLNNVQVAQLIERYCQSIEGGPRL